MKGQIQRISDVERRMPEAGRIRLGVKSGKAMKSIDTLRFTSQHQEQIELLAQQLGGTARPWSDPKADPQHQFEVITTSSAIDVYLPRDGLTSVYELWAGGGVVRRCDGAIANLPESRGNDWAMTQQPCICARKQLMECRPYTRLNVIIPTLPFAGVWRLETKGWNALAELPGMADMAAELSDGNRLISVRLSVERREAMRAGKKRNFVVPRLALNHTVTEIMAGQAGIAAVSAAGVPVAIGPGTRSRPGGAESGLDPGTVEASAAVEDDGIVDAEIITEEETQIRECAEYYGMDGNRLWAALHAVATSDPNRDSIERLRMAIALMKDGRQQPTGFTADGKVIWHREGS